MRYAEVVDLDADDRVANARRVLARELADGRFELWRRRGWPIRAGSDAAMLIAEQNGPVRG